MSLFDSEALLGARHTEEIDTKFHLCPETECVMQIIELRLREGQSEKVPVTWANLDVVWEIMDDNIKTQMNMQKVTVSQQIFVDLVQNGSGGIALPVRLDWGVNRNMALKRIMEATGVKRTNFSLNDLKFQSAWGKVEHENDRDGATNADGTPVKYAHIKRVAPVSAAKR